MHKYGQAQNVIWGVWIPSRWSRMTSLHEQHPDEAQVSFALVLFVFPLAESYVFHFESGALGFEDLYVLIKPTLLWYVETENLAACRVDVLERVIEKQRVVSRREVFVFESVNHECEFAEIFGHRVDFVVFNSLGNCRVFFGNVRKVAIFGEVLVKFFDRSCMECFYLVGDDACLVPVFIPKVREKFFCVFFAERVCSVAFADECFLDVLEPGVAGDACCAEI